VNILFSGTGKISIMEENKGKKTPEQERSADKDKSPPKETGGPAGPEPTRYGDWERKGRCVDF